ncbi:winged helix-turn-helix domain-containing protein [Caballeronia sordidicola]|uniref:Signal transduction response regulator n=1 Tax=Caballeronia sordidicola TaxID=196367 RepID=A0A226WNG4_CABSO|nr:winged helix-turn-helix domain-containing protein [Caballeronia sordidicola]OXC72716.1 Signal transduction response regulator [Caballeronia sordidicola]
MIKIGRVNVSLELRQLCLDGQTLHVGSRAFDILEVLIKARGKLVSKNELFQCVWPNTVVEESNLQVHISTLRRLLGDDKDLIKTIPGRGYRLTCSDEAEGLAQKRTDESAHTEERRPPSNVPLSYTPLVGRAQALKDVKNALGAASLVTLVGTGGIGKTQLGLEVARTQQSSFDEVCYVNLSVVEHPECTVCAIADSLTVRKTAEIATQADLTRAIGTRKLLIVLDNCEHVIHEAATLCEQLMLAHPHLSVLATSREPLRIRFEKIYWVAPLEVPPEDASYVDILQCSAAHMFVSRVRALDPRFRLDAASVRLIGTICRRLDGLPLALEFAAARVGALGVGELAVQLNNRFRVLTGGLRTAPARQQTLKAALDWSYQFLCNQERMVFRRISVFRQSFQLDAACEIAAHDDLSTDDVIEAIAGLVSKSLLMFGPSGSLMNYRLLETTREYALQMLEDAGESETMIHRYERYLRSHGSSPDEADATGALHRGTGIDGRAQDLLLSPPRSALRLQA